METDIFLRGEKVALRASTNELWHEFYRNYTVDPMMDETPYAYDFERLERAYRVKAADASRLYFVIIHDDRVIGQIYLKHMDRQAGTTEFGVALINDSVKGKGFGTEAIRLLTDYAFRTLGFETIYADSVLRNARSRHVLDKTGFVYTHEDEVFAYYKLER